ncbi:hypothetical protein [Desulfotruncus alcoholivorax]|uniref:hypothetical protein n=1 Tax=Desulfotruncus alcoholivorax TaxID=265477 RepID=UPI000429D775|nr:hypothetical protein [Desulfotruncus alcoholivorax]
MVETRKFGIDPLEIAPVNPIDYRCVNGKWVYDPGWWREIPLQHRDKAKEKNQRSKTARRRSRG